MANRGTYVPTYCGDCKAPAVKEPNSGAYSIQEHAEDCPQILAHNFKFMAHSRSEVKAFALFPGNCTFCGKGFDHEVHRHG